MRIQPVLNFTEEEIISYLTKAGYEVEMLDFGYWSERHGTRGNWEEDICLGVMTLEGKKQIDVAFAEHIAPTIERKLKDILF